MGTTNDRAARRDAQIARSARVHDLIAAARARGERIGTARVRITNNTGWSTVDLRRFLVRILRNVGAWGRYDVTVDGARGPGSSGCATYSSRWFLVRVRAPKGPDDRLTAYDLEEFASTTVHEWEHALGLRHAEMIGGTGRTLATRRANVAGAPLAWIHAVEVRPKVTVAVPVPTAEDRAALRAERARARAARREQAARDALARWELRLRRARTKVARYRARVRAIERRRAARAASASTVHQPQPTEGGS